MSVDRLMTACSFLVLLIVCVAPTLTSGAFPRNFAWGTGTASYQIEGAVTQDGRVPTIWDIFSHTPGKTAGGGTGDVADDSYNKWPIDIALMKTMGIPAFRFSIAWSRIITLDGRVNQRGIDHYNTLINALLSNNIQPYVTLYHWDLPAQFSTFNVSTHGWLDSDYIVPHFVRYADVCFGAFGDRVKHWTTFNEPQSFCLIGYESGVHAPGRCSDRTKCAEGNSVTEPYLCIHSVALAHAYAVNIFRTKYRDQGGLIGMTTDASWYEPLTNSTADRAASERALAFHLGAFTDPIITGDWNPIMKERAGKLLIPFTDAEKRVLRGSVDFFALNHYTSRFIGAPSGTPPPPGQGFDADSWVNIQNYRNGVAIGPPADSPWLLVTPQWFPNLMRWVHRRYPALDIYITENGCDVPNENSFPLQQALNDTFRVNYLHDYIQGIQQVLNEGLPIKGYFLWSLLDNYEWADSYSKRFGIHYVDYPNNQTRYAKRSSKWYAQLIATGQIPPANTTFPDDLEMTAPQPITPAAAAM